MKNPKILKRLLIAIGFIIVCAGIGFIIWYLTKNQTTKSDYTDILDLKKHGFDTNFKKPILGFKNGILTKNECLEIIELGKKIIKPSKVGFDYKENSSRTSSHGWLKTGDHPAIKRVTEYLGNILKIPVENFESWQCVNYKTGQKYLYHTDSCNPTATDYKDCKENEKKKGCRIYTALIYINDDYEGGHTHFKNIDTKVRGPAGSMVIFKNVTDGKHNETNIKSMHAGLPPTSGEKWLINVWIRDKNQSSG